MAASAVYCNIVRVPDAGRMDENTKFSNIGITTAAFNLDLLARINRELGGNFDLRHFGHEARYNQDDRSKWQGIVTYRSSGLCGFHSRTRH